MKPLSTPGVYVQEIASLPPSVAPVSTAIPAFIGYTEKRPADAIEARRISTLREYHDLYGGAFAEPFTATVTVANGRYNVRVQEDIVGPKKPSYWMYYQLLMYFANGGGPCFIVSVGIYKSTEPKIALTEIENGLKALEKEDEPTLILSPDIVGILPSDPDDGNLTNYYSHYQNTLLQCAGLKDRFAIIDLHSFGEDDTAVNDFREKIGTNNLNYGAAYYPWLETTLGYGYKESEVEITVEGSSTPTSGIKLKYDTFNLDALENPADLDGSTKQKYYEDRSLFHLDNGAYNQIKNAIESFRLTLPPGAAVAGIYARVDATAGVFKAPANVSVNNVVRPSVKISNEKQADLNVHPSGKSVNAIRTFSDKGILVWGARTLDGNSNEWRYIPVRRLFIFLEESIGKAIERFVFEPNNESTRVKVKATNENFLTDQWRSGALAGSTPAQAYFVNVGLGQTMSSQDILEGRLVVNVGIAAVRPAEFIVLRFSHKLQEA